MTITNAPHQRRGDSTNAVSGRAGTGHTAQRPEIAWRQIAAMRNFFVHEYFNLDHAVVEDVIINDLDPLNTAVSGLLDITDEDSGPNQ
ncbi:HepT-like ribonuclease domain-containing protein [Mycobacterium alsense]|uniref:HepT-like ribonuclease domain-containing protein n=1 Tax=Mycobacterium alsense TaxID=324058 RepID=UPI0035593107